MLRPQARQVGNRRAVQPAQLEYLDRGQPLRASPSLGYQRPKPVPICLALGSEYAYLHAYLMDSDRIEISTPEGLNLEMTLAGLGSRSAAAIIDTLIIVVMILAVAIPFRNGGGTIIEVFRIVTPFLLFFGYHMFFETTGRRQSPGKRLLSLRVVRADGSPAGGVETLIRNLLRLVDFLPSFYLIGIITVFATSQNQRLGDLAAGVVVVAEPNPAGVLPTDDLPPFHDLPEGWDVSAVTDQDVAVLREFLSRRFDLAPDARRKIALQIASTLDRKVSRPSAHMSSEQLMEIILDLKQRRGQ